MPDLRRVLADYDLALLNLIAGQWDITLQAASQREAVEALAAQMLAPERVTAVVAALPEAAAAAFDGLVRAGRQPLAQFTRRYGELRAMGPARRERERPWENAPSSAEVLWYRALIGRAFFDDGRGPEEFVFVPDDLRSLLHVPAAPTASAAAQPPGQSVAAPAAPASALGAAAEDAVTLLAYLQVVGARPEGNGLPERHRESLSRFLRQPAALELDLHLVRELGLAAQTPLKLDPERVQPFLHAPRPERARQLAEAWRASREWNDLLCVPGLIFEGLAWRNDPASARQAVLALLKDVPAGTWWSLDSFVAAVKERQPDFQRPAGDYDSWYIRDAETGTYLRGFAHWERVDGALVRWLIAAPLFWLGLVEVAPAPGTGPAAAFRLTPHGAALLGQAGWEAPDEPPAPLEVEGDLTLRVPPAASAHDRFQLARISDWLPPEGDTYVYRLTPSALARAAKKGIDLNRMIGFLERAVGDASALPAIATALRRWERHGTEAVLRETVVLQLTSADLLDTLRRTPHIREFLGPALGPTAVTVRRDDLPALRVALARVGILVDD